MSRARSRRSIGPYVTPSLDGTAVHRMRIERFRQQLTQAALAKNARVPISYVSKYECGRLRPSPAHAGRLAGVLGLTVADLFGELTGTTTT